MIKYLPILALFILVALHLSLIDKTFSQDSAGNFRAASAGYGDIPFHMTQVSKFAFQNNIDFNEPIFDGERMRYAFSINLISGFLLRYSGNWPLAMHLPAMGFMVAGIILTFLSFRLFLKSSSGAAVAIIIFLLGSGFGTNYLLTNYSEGSTTGGSFYNYLIETTASTITKWDATYPEQNIGWGAPLSLVFLHQRSFFLGFFMFALFWYLLWHWIRSPANIRLSIFLGLVVGLSILSHYHSFIAMLTVLFVLALYGIFKRKKQLVLGMILVCFIIFVLAIPQILYLVEGKNNLTSTQNSFIEFRLGWMSQPTTGSIQFDPNSHSYFSRALSFLNFTWINFGVILPMFLISTVVFLKSSRIRERFNGILIISAFAAALFLLVQLIRFQPWDYDNNKILVYFQFFAAPTIVAFFMWLSDHRKLVGGVLFASFVVIAIHSGIVDQIPRLAVAKEDTPIIFNKDAIFLADFIRESLPQDKKIITTSTHLNLVASLTGRPVFLGYPGWLWTRGINYEQREQQLKKIYLDPKSNLDRVYSQKNSVYFNEAQYVLLDPTALNEWSASKETFDENFNRLFSNNTYSLYKIR